MDRIQKEMNLQRSTRTDVSNKLSITPRQLRIRKFLTDIVDKFMFSLHLALDLKGIIYP